MTPEAFIRKWRDVQTKERAAAQEHFIDLCRLLGEPTPNEADPAGDWYAFERGAQRTGAGRGWADVWKRGHFGWEYKGKHANLDTALRQLQLYALALESPPLLVVCDLDTIRIHTAFTNAVQETHVVALDDLADPQVRQILKWLFTDPERLLESGHKNPQHLPALLGQLFGAMRQGGPFGADIIDWFNGGLFDGDDMLPLQTADVATLLELARLD